MKRLLILTVLATMMSMSSGCMSSNSCSSNNGGFHPFYNWFHRGDACDSHYGASGACGCGSGSMVSGVPNASYIPSGGGTMISPLPGPRVETLPN